MIVLLCHSVSPYHAARFLALEKARQDFVVVELFHRQNSNPWMSMVGAVQRQETLFEGAIEDIPTAAQMQAVASTLKKHRPSAVVAVGYSEPVMRSASAWAKQRGVFSVMMTDTWKGDRRRYLPLELAKSAWCRRMYDAVFVSGARSADYFKGLGLAEGKIWRGVDVVDNDYFAHQANMAQQAAAALRARYDLPERYFLCCARLSREKNIAGLLEAYRQYRRRGGRWGLALVGDGPQRKELEAQAQDVQGVQFFGWKQYDELPVFYGLAGCFVLASRSEPWGLVINEAMASGLPVLVSRKCGCLPELCWRGVNGWDFDPRDPGELAELLLAASGGKLDLPSMGAESRQIIGCFTPGTWAKTLLACLAAGGV